MLIAPSEDRTHDLEIMRLARCLLRYRGLIIVQILVFCKLHCMQNDIVSNYLNKIQVQDATLERNYYHHRHYYHH